MLGLQVCASMSYKIFNFIDLFRFGVLIIYLLDTGFLYMMTWDSLCSSGCP